MDWYDVEAVLFDGDKKDIEKLRCPDCGGNISFSYYPEVKSFEVSCLSCGYLSKGYGGDVPNCYKYFGERDTIE